jgi:hypothetical protein
MQSQAENQQFNKSISIGFLFVLCALMLVYHFQETEVEDFLTLALSYSLLLFCPFQICYVIVYKLNYKTFGFWLMLVVLVFTGVYWGLLWYASQLARGFNH